MEMRFTIRLSLMFEPVTICKWLLTRGTNKTIRMPLSVQSRNEIFRDRYATFSTFWGKHTIITFLTKSLFVFFVKAVITKWFLTIKTNKTFWMPCAIQGWNTFIQNGFVTCCTFGWKKSMIIVFTIGLTFSFEKILCSKFLKTKLI